MNGDNAGFSGNKYKFEKNEDSKLPEGFRMTITEQRVEQEFDDLQVALKVSSFSTKVNERKWADLETGSNPSARRGGVTWFGVDGIGARGVQNVKRLIHDGWEDGVKQMQEALQDVEVTSKPRGLRRTRRWADQGDSVEMPRVWAGRVDVAWQRCSRLARTSRQNVTIVANITALMGVDARDLFWRGAAVLKLTDLLIEAGYNVEIYGVRVGTSSYANGLGLMQKIKLKDALAPLDLNSLASTICLAGFFRTVLFQCQCAVGLKIDWDMGRSAAYVGTPGEIFGVESCRSKESARAWIEEQIRLLEQPE